jgi:hypothetical protein
MQHVSLKILFPCFLPRLSSSLKRMSIYNLRSSLRPLLREGHHTPSERLVVSYDLETNSFLISTRLYALPNIQDYLLVDDSLRLTIFISASM